MPVLTPVTRILLQEVRCGLWRRTKKKEKEKKNEKKKKKHDGILAAVFSLPVYQSQTLGVKDSAGVMF